MPQHPERGLGRSPLRLRLQPDARPRGRLRRNRRHLRDFDLDRPRPAAGSRPRRHCFGCTAGAGSSCGGALTELRRGAYSGLPLLGGALAAFGLQPRPAPDFPSSPCPPTSPSRRTARSRGGPRIGDEIVVGRAALRRSSVPVVLWDEPRGATTPAPRGPASGPGSAEGLRYRPGRLLDDGEELVQPVPDPRRARARRSTSSSLHYDVCGVSSRRCFEIVLERPGSVGALPARHRRHPLPDPGPARDKPGTRARPTAGRSGSRSPTSVRTRPATTASSSAGTSATPRGCGSASPPTRGAAACARRSSWRGRCAPSSSRGRCTAPSSARPT